LWKYPEKRDSPAYSLTNNICLFVLYLLIRVFPLVAKTLFIIPFISKVPDPEPFEFSHLPDDNVCIYLQIIIMDFNFIYCLPFKYKNIFLSIQYKHL
jgi:hypothetical protein